MKRTFVVVFFMVFILWTTAALAADTYKWTGVDFGIQGSWAVGKTDWSYQNNGRTVDHRIDGWTAGGFVGYNYQFPFNLVLGVETDLNYASIKGFDTCPNPSWTGHSEIDWVGSTRLRVGYAIYRFLPYIAIGPAYGRVNVFTKNSAGVEFGEKKTYLGVSPSIGLDFAITDNFFARAEYDYIYLGKNEMAVDFGNVVDTKVAFSNFKLAIGFKF